MKRVWQCVLIFILFVFVTSGTVSAHPGRLNKKGDVFSKNLSTPVSTAKPTAAPTAMSAGEDTQGNTNGNIANSGFAAIGGDWIYYSNINDDGKLYKIKTDGTGRIKLSDDTSHSINVVGDWVYCVGFKMERFNYKYNYKIRTDGSAWTELDPQTSNYEKKVPVLSRFIVVDDWMYSTSVHNSIYRVSTRFDGTYEKIADNVVRNLLSSAVADGWIYYNDYSYGSDMLYKIRIDGTEKTKLLSEIGGFVNVVDDWIYYYSYYHGGLYKVRTDGTQRTKLLDGSFRGINVDGDWIYFCANFNESDPNYYLYKVKTDGTGKTLLSSQIKSAFGVNVVGDWVYYNDLGNTTYYRIKTDGTENQAVN